jgi:hypothetical protein
VNGVWVLVAGYAMIVLLRWSAEPLPHTSDSDKLIAYAKRRRSGSKLRLRPDLVASPFIIVSTVLLAAAIALAALTDSCRLVAAAALGIVVAAAAGWSWWRTTGTFMQYLLRIGEASLRKDQSDSPPKPIEREQQIDDRES